MPALRFLPRGPLLDVAGRPTPPWERFFRDLLPLPIFVPRLVWNQGTQSVASQPITEIIDQPAVVHVTYATRIEQAATTSSELTVAFAWTDGGVAQTFTAPTLTGNTTTTEQSAQLLARVDAGTALAISTVRVSLGVTPMRYNLDVALAKVATAILKGF